LAKKLIISLVLVVMTLNYIRIVGPFFDYVINYDYIITELCVEKDEIINDCCGSCVVTENLDNVIKDEQQSPATPGQNHQKSIKELMPHFLSGFQIPKINFTFRVTDCFYDNKNPLKRESQPDTPPPRV
jgi:hypothetical protein